MEDGRQQDDDAPDPSQQDAPRQGEWRENGHIPYVTKGVVVVVVVIIVAGGGGSDYQKVTVGGSVAGACATVPWPTPWHDRGARGLPKPPCGYIRRIRTYL
jgi:hypothetical protein